MAGYTSHWNCWICNEAIESDAVPKMRVCDKCLTPVADLLLKEKFAGASITDDGIDGEYWLRRADRLVGPMMRRRRSA